jgi:hypothetical protein
VLVQRDVVLVGLLFGDVRCRAKFLPFFSQEVGMRHVIAGGLALALISGSSARANLSVPITKGPLNSLVTPLTGPTVDPSSQNGQWFLNSAGPEYRTHEFHDNIVGSGGAIDDIGGNGSLAIRSSNISLIGTPTFSTGFKVRATVFNNTALSSSGTPLVVDNAHGETPLGNAGGGNDNRQKYVGTMFDVKMTAEFSYAGNTAGPGVSPAMLGGAPYFNTPLTILGLGGPTPNPIYAQAQNHQQLGWYCWSPLAPQPTFQSGAFLVPTWDFGSIAPGASASVDMIFNFTDFFGSPAQVPNTDALIALLQSNQDIFMNRSSDIKVGDFFDVLNADTGVSYDASIGRSGNVSVFHNIPEPAALTVCAAALLIASRRQRRVVTTATSHDQAA